jgi:diadenosine tetraphosphatase ApaH/serine/threonine PP2A family protein phosphatase
LDLSSLFKESLQVQSSTLIETVDFANSLLQSESREKGNLTITNHLVQIKPIGEALVVGDLHGDIDSLVLILQTSDFLEKMQLNYDATLIFLGDYGDRGNKSAEIYYLILRLKLAFPDQVVLLRGNHEAPKSLLGEPHDLPYQLQARFGNDWILVYERLQALWSNLYNAVFVKDRYLMVHGGISSQICNLQDIAQAQEGHNEAVLEDLLWSDPTEDEVAVEVSPRGAGKLFGKSVTTQVLTRLKAKILIRGHEASDSGYKINHGGKVLTLFSRKGSPYFNRFGAYLQVPLEQEFEKAKSLEPWVRQF